MVACFATLCASDKGATIWVNPREPGVGFKHMRVPLTALDLDEFIKRRQTSEQAAPVTGQSLATVTSDSLSKQEQPLSFGASGDADRFSLVLKGRLGAN
jgi:hypothetical protein